MQTVAVAPTFRGRHDATVAYSNGPVGKGQLREYIVPESSSWLKSLQSTPFTKVHMDLVEGRDKRPILSVKFQKSVPYIEMHQLLIKSGLEGRVTRWGTILLPLLTPAAETLFRQAGGEVPADRIKKFKAARKLVLCRRPC